MARPPDFICIGAQKAGTTWLYKMLSKHPDVWMPKGRKEVHYFDREILRRPLTWYHELFHDPSGATRICGEKTPNYAHLKPRSIRLIRDLYPELRIIFLLRHPADRAWSHARMEVSDYNKRPLTEADNTRCIYHVGITRNSQLTRYDRMLGHWEQYFPANQMLVLFYEDIERRPSELLSRVAEFLGIEPCSDWSAERTQKTIWASPDLAMPPAIKWYLGRRYERVVEHVRKRYPGLPECWNEEIENVPSNDTARVSGFEKLRTWFRCGVLTLPYNAAYAAYDVVRDVRMAIRLRAVRAAHHVIGSSRSQSNQELLPVRAGLD